MQICKIHRVWFGDRCPQCRGEKKPSKIKPVSEKRNNINRLEYGPKSKAYILANPLCKVNAPGCLLVSRCVHHIAGKENKTKLLDEANWLPSCVPCNNWIEANHKEAEEMGVRKSKHTPDYKRIK